MNLDVSRDPDGAIERLCELHRQRAAPPASC